MLLAERDRSTCASNEKGSRRLGNLFLLVPRYKTFRGRDGTTDAPGAPLLFQEKMTRQRRRMMRKPVFTEDPASGLSARLRHPQPGVFFKKTVAQNRSIPCPKKTGQFAICKQALTLN
jgi:hypothetical protein